MDQPETIASVADRVRRRFKDLVDNDPQIAEAMPLKSVQQSVKDPGLSYCDVIARVLAGYSDRPALGMRAYELHVAGEGSRRVRLYLPSFSTITYGELASKVEAVAAAWQHHPRHEVKRDEFVALIAFASTEMVAVDLACAYAQAIAIPIQANLPKPDMLAVFENTDPVTLVASIENLELAVEYARLQKSVRSLVVIDSDVGVDDERERIDAARCALISDGDRVALATFEEIVEFGSQFEWTPLPRHPEGEDALVMLMHTSGSTGTPKGAMIHEAICTNLWNGVTRDFPTINLVCAPMNHFLGRNQIFGALAQGGTAFFTLRSDMSTLFEDIRLARPTSIMLFPRIAETIYRTYQAEVQRRVAAGGEPNSVSEAVHGEMRDTFLGDRVLSGGVGSSPTAPEVRHFLHECFRIPIINGYSCTEGSPRAITVDGQIQRDVILDYRLIDVPELGFYSTDRPYPRGELLLKSRFAIKGYYKRSEATAEIFDDEGWLHTGDIVEERGPDNVVWVSRRNNVLKLAQAEYVALGPLEATYTGNSELISQIYLYGNSYRSFLLAVVVPDMDHAKSQLGHDPTMEELRRLVLAELQGVARVTGLKSFEVPRDVLIELEPFSHENGLLSSVRKPLHPKLKDQYQDALEAIYLEMDRKQNEELAQLRSASGGQSVLDRVAGAFKAQLGLNSIATDNLQSFTDLGGDSLGAVSLSVLLEELFGAMVPVSIILDPTGNASRIAQFVEHAIEEDSAPSFASVHGEDAKLLRSSDLKLKAFLEPTFLKEAANATAAVEEPRQVLLTGATGFLGRFLCLEWMEQLSQSGGKLFCLVRGTDATQARARLDEAVGTGDSTFADRFGKVARDHLEIVPGDLAMPRLGLDQPTFERLSEEIDQVVHAGALVNHLLSYQNLFEPNVRGTAELIRLALAGRQKRFEFVSTIGVPRIDGGLANAFEDMDVREGAGQIELSDDYAVGYGASKWASEILLRETHEHFGLPVTIYRPDMIMAHSQFRGQINVPDMFTRLVLSLALAGIAPASFYGQAREGGGTRAHYDGIPVDFLAATIQRLGLGPWHGFRIFNTISSHIDDGVSLDTFVDWIVSGGYPIERIEDHADWLRRFSDTLRHLPDDLRSYSASSTLGYVDRPHPVDTPAMHNENFVAALRGLGEGSEIPPLTERYIHKYLDDLRFLGLLPDLG